MNYISLFSGIEAATVAWEPLGFTPVAFSEIDPFCCELLAQKYPNVPNLGDVSKIDWSEYRGAVDLVVGGSPCQAFSVAGRRGGLMDERGGLMYEYIRCVGEVAPRWLLWENVPGVLSQDEGEAFGTLLGELEDLGYSLCWRVLDAQFFGVAQRRRRVFVVGNASVGRAASVLFEPDSVSGAAQTGKEKREALTRGHGTGAGAAIAGNVINRSDGNGGNGRGYEDDGGCYTLTAFDQHAVYEPRAMTQNSRDELRYINGDGSISGSLCATRYGTGKEETLIQEPLTTADRMDSIDGGGHIEDPHNAPTDRGGADDTA